MGRAGVAVGHSDEIVDDIGTRIGGAVNDVLAAAPEVPAIIVGIRSPRATLTVARARSGVLPAEAVFRTASVAKTFTAAAVLNLVDRGDVDLDQPIARLVSPAVRDLLPALSPAPATVTPRLLLQHRAGVADYAVDPDWRDAIERDPARVWSGLELVAWAATRLEPVAQPAATYSYSDTGYVLLAEMIEHLTGLELPAAYRALLPLQRLGMGSTWLEGREPPPVASPVYAPGNLFGYDVWTVHPSNDTFGGGGLVSTAADIGSFFEALLTDRVVPPAMRLEMTTTLPAGDDGAAGLGLFRRETPLGPAWGHTGAMGAFAFTWPERGLTVAGSVCSAQEHYVVEHPRTVLLDRVLPLLDRVAPAPKEIP